jgi:hypothetical protein
MGWGMGIWAGIRRALGYADRSPMPYQPSSMTFQDLDADAIKSNLRLESRGQRRGENNQPPSDATTLDEVEREVIDFIQNEQKKSTDQYLQNMRAFSARLSHFDLEKSVVDIKNEADKVVTDFNIEAMQGLDYLETFKGDLREAKRDLNSFQQDNDRRRAAVTKSLPWLCVSAMVMLVLFIGESVFNGQMLGQGLINGLSGGLIYAMGFAIINIIMGIVMGQFGFRAKNHIAVGNKIIAWLVILVLLTISATFNLGVGHYRDELNGAHWEDASRLAVVSLLHAPLNLVTLQSYILFVFGIGISLLVGLDIYYMDDPYPGYGAVARSYKKSVDQFIDAKDQIKDQLQDWRDEAVKRMEASREQAGRWRTDYGTIISSTNTVSHALEIHNAHLQSVGNRLLEAYRGENGRSRKTPAPAHFSREFTLTSPQAPIVTPPRVFAEDEIANLVGEATSVLEKAVALLNDEYQKHMERFSTILEVLAVGPNG